MNLQEKAQMTINIEFPGKTLLSALDAANQKLFDGSYELRDLEAQIEKLKYERDQLIYVLQDTERARNLLENALDEAEAS